MSTAKVKQCSDKMGLVGFPCSEKPDVYKLTNSD